MDDYLDSFSTAEKAIEVSQELVKILQKGDFMLTKFGSNNKIVLEAISRDSEVDEGTKTHILGLKWNRADDILTVSRFLNPNPQPCLTQRVVLKCVASVFDPIGIVAPFTRGPPMGHWDTGKHCKPVHSLEPIFTPPWRAEIAEKLFCLQCRRPRASCFRGQFARCVRGGCVSTGKSLYSWWKYIIQIGLCLR